MNEHRVVKLKDIARELGLSESTVSRALSGTGRVSEATRLLVQNAVKKRNYTPNDIARSLRRRDGRSIGIIVTDITNIFFASVLKGAQMVAHGQGYSTLISNSDEEAALETASLRLMLEKQVSGLILATVGGSPEQLAQCRRLGVPIVFIDNLPTLGYPYDSVSVDNHKSAYLLTRKLLERGMRRIGVITGPLDQSSGLHRWEGFERAMQEAQLPIHQLWVRQGDFRVESGYAAMSSILSQQDTPQAVIVANNYMAFGAIRAIRERGQQVPRDIAIVSFDTEDISGLMHPAITTMNQPAVDIGRQAAEILIDRLTDNAPEHAVAKVLDPIFVEGNSW